jgi:hypothetical protein
MRIVFVRNGTFYKSATNIEKLLNNFSIRRLKLWGKCNSKILFVRRVCEKKTEPYFIE